MSTDQTDPAVRLSAYWRAVKAGYRYANGASYHLLGALLKLIVLVYFIFCALFLTLRYAVLPGIDRYKGEVEQVISRAIDHPVSIATIQASWQGLQPRLSLTDVVIHDKEGRQALRLPKVSATLSWWSVAVANLRLYSLEIDSPDVDIQRATDGNLYVAGILIDTHQSSNGKGADWILSQREIVIHDGRVRWNDRQRGAPELVLNNVNFALFNHWSHHRFGLTATPPSALATPLDIRAAFDHPHFARKISDPALWKGELYVDLRDTDLAAWKTYVDYPIELQQGRGSVRAWLNFDHAKLAEFTADLTLSHVSTVLRKDLQPLNLVQVHGRVSVREDIDSKAADGASFGDRGHAISLTDFSLLTEDGLSLPTTTMSESFVPRRGDRPARTDIKAKLIDLQTVADFVGRLPLPAEQRKILLDFAPRGRLQEFSAQWQGEYPDISSYSLKGAFIGLSMNAQAPRPARLKTAKTPAQAAVPGIPGFDNLTGRVDMSDRGGNVNLASKKLELTLPGYFNEPRMPFDRLTVQANWTFPDKDKLLLQVDKAAFVQDGVVGSFSGKQLMPLTAQPGQLAGNIDLVGRIEEFDVKKIGRYLPSQTPEHLRAWLTGALEDGTARDVSVRIRGDLKDFPFHTDRPSDRPKGEFSIVGKIEHGKLNYTPGTFAKDGKAPLWPLLEDIKGTIAFDRTRMEIKADSARTAGVALSDVKAVIPDLMPADKMLDIDGNAAGPLQDFVGFTNDSPVAEWIGHFTEETKAGGNARLALQLQLPLARMMETKVKGSLQFANNEVVLQTGMPPLSATNGKLEFHENGFSLNAIRASFLGGAVTISGGSQQDRGILVKADGSITAAGLRKAYATPTMQGLTERISGAARYSMTVGVKKGRPGIVVESNLQGLGLDFPVPLRKAANENMPFRFELAPLASSDAASERDEMKMTLGTAISARYERVKPSDRSASWSVVRGGIGVNVPAPQPDSGVIANVNLKALNLDAWRNVVTAMVSGDTPKDKVNPADTLNIAQYIEPEVLAARAVELTVLGKKLDNVVVGASHQKNVWQANIDSQQASGYLTWNESTTGAGLGKVTARLASLIIPKSVASDVTDLLEGKNAATQMPELDVVAENFELVGKKLGRLELAANNIRASAVREWRINKLSIANPDAELKATGKWTSKEGDSISNLTYTLDVANAGTLLERFGFANVLRGGKGKMTGDISWKGLPFSIDIPSLSGKFKLDLASGQFLKVEPGAAKLLGVLSLQSLPRRLTLDFRDVFSEGFAFDGITATVAIAQGVAKTDNFKMRGVNATVLMDGAADIAKESQNLHVVVIPDINVGAASVVYGLAVNPVIGLGSFLAQLFLREPLMRAFTYEYQITGPWQDPVVNKLARKVEPVGKAPASANENPEKAS